MEKQFKFSTTEFIKTLLGVNLVITIVICFVLVRRQWFEIQVVPIIFLVINFIFLFKTFGVAQILSITIRDKVVSIQYILPLFQKHSFECKVSDVTVEKNSELGFRGSKREVFIFKFKNLQSFKIYIDDRGWEKLDLEEIQKVLNG